MKFEIVKNKSRKGIKKRKKKGKKLYLCDLCYP